MEPFQRNRIRALISNLKNKGILKSTQIYSHKTRNRIRAFLSDWIFETRFATDTRSIVPLGRLSIASENKSLGVHYEPTRYFILKAIFDLLEVDYSNCGFVDFGSGKGRVLVFASEYGFGNITGVEFSHELCEHSRRNLEAYAQKTGKRFRYEVLHADAAAYEVRKKDNVFFFFNPFGEKVLTRVLENIDRSLKRRNRDAFFIYVNPVHNAVFSRRYLQVHTVENHEKQYSAIIYKNEFPENRTAPAAPE